MSALIQTIGRLFDPVLNFFQQVWNYITSFLSFLWDLIEGLYYGFNTIISYTWNAIGNLLDNDYFGDNLDNLSYLSALLGYDAFKIFAGILLVSIFYVVLKYIFSLIPFFHK